MAVDGDHPGERPVRFIEAMGLYFEDAGIPRIGGRLLGLLMVSHRPLPLDAIADTLQVSRASVSTNARLLVTSGLIERVSLPGDRRDYYGFSARAWERALEADISVTLTLRRLAAEGLAELDPSDTTARARLRDAVAFAEFYAAELSATVERWRARAAVRAGAAGDPA